MSQNKKLTPLNRIKNSAFERAFSVAKMGLNAGLKYASHKAGGSDRDSFLSAQAAYITGELGQLKGSLMKAGQMLSMYGEYFFPPQANQFLKKLQTDSPPIEWATMKENLENYLAPELLDELEINPEALGSASMGQVHRARIKATGEQLALKIQYPGLEKAIDSDIKALKTLLQISKIIPSEIDLTPVMEEIKIMLRQELDYTQEADLTESYAAHLEGDERFVVPKVFRRYSSKQILATQYLEGVKFDHPLVQSLSESRRNQLSKNFIELYFKEIFEWNLVQTDPHLGNYKVQIDAHGKDRLVLLDFGACRKFSEDFIQAYRGMVKGSILDDRVLFRASCEKLGYIQATDSLDYIQAFENFCNETVEPFWAANDPRNAAGKINAEGLYNWKQTDLPSRVVKKALQFKNFDLRSPPREILFMDRKTGGVFIALAVLQAHINARKIIDPYLERV